MKTVFKLLAFSFFSIVACHDDEIQGISTCMAQKIEEFKSNGGAISVIRINRPGDPQYWFRTIVYVDAGENVYDSDCHLTCHVGCYCPEEYRCDPSLFNFPQEIIWQK